MTERRSFGSRFDAGREILAMSADRAEVTVSLRKITGPDYYAWLTFPYTDWTSFLRLVRDFTPPANDFAGLTVDSPGFGSIEELASSAAAFTVGAWTLCLTKAHLASLREAVDVADRRVLKWGQE
jgi:hypothetical protein